MAKGMFTQGVMVLLEAQVNLDMVEGVLAGYDIARRMDVPEPSDWMGTWPTLIVPFRPEVNGYVLVDILSRAWPDGMGDPKKNPTLFAAWTFGQFGPVTFPGNLERSIQQTWQCEEAIALVPRHQAMIRVRTSYALGADDNSPIIPADYDPAPELDFVTRLAAAVAQLPQALCVFNPGGETLFTPSALVQILEHDTKENLPALDAWTNVRLFNLSDVAPWMVVDSIGMSQLDLRDQELCFDSDRHEVDAIVQTARNMSLYLLRNGEIIEDGDTIDIGSQKWKCAHRENSFFPSPRRVLRWFPLDGTNPPKVLR